MTSTSLDLFGAPETAGAPAPAREGRPSSMTLTGTGQPPEWGPYTLDIVFANRKAYRKSLTSASSAELVRALWDYAIARHESLMARRAAGGAQAVLSGHRNLNDKLDLALRLIESHCIDVGDIPAAREFGPQIDLRHLAGESPFPVSDGAAR
ncbi:hypothetical protein LJR290_007722 [Variovorax sp. LjRoot290]|uniref:hypothetical protein n=1 Tax=unclassified Variovorax TaxID=663243 RepID=UPI003ED021BF